MKTKSPRRAPGGVFRAFTVLALLLAATAGGALFADDRGLKPFYDFVVEVGGVVDPGWKMYAPAQKTKILLVSPSKDQYFMLSVSEKAARPVDRSLTKMNADGSIDALAGSVSTTRIIPLVQSGSSISFSLDTRTIALKPRPPLVGPHSLSELISDRPTFGEGIQKYQPEAAAVSYLKAYSKPTEIEVFFGSWCSVCEAWVPKFLKSLNEAGNAKIQYQLIGVAHDYQEAAKNEGVRGLPTFIIRQNGVEVGRIVGAPQTGTVEGALADVLRSKSETPSPTSKAAPSQGAKVIKVAEVVSKTAPASNSLASSSSSKGAGSAPASNPPAPSTPSKSTGASPSSKTATSAASSAAAKAGSPPR
jgi:thiol-disulfide isomerase/thioredoxin